MWYKRMKSNISQNNLCFGKHSETHKDFKTFVICIYLVLFNCVIDNFFILAT